MIKKIFMIILLSFPLLAGDYYAIVADEQYLYLCQPENKSIQIISRQNKKEILLNDSAGFNLQAPVSLAVSGERLFVLDGLVGKVLEYQKTATGFNFVKSHLSGLTGARDLECWQNQLFVLDSAKSRILALDLNSDKEKVLTDKIEIDGAYGLSVDAEGFIYIADTFRHRIVKLDQKGNFINFLATGLIENLRYPRDVTAGFGNNLYITDSGNNRLLVVNKLSGELSHVLKDNFKNVLRNLYLDNQSAKLFYCCGDSYDQIQLTFPEVNFGLINNQINPKNEKMDQPIATIKSDSSLNGLIQLFDERGILFSEKNNYSAGINLVNLKDDLLKDGKYQLRAIFFDEKFLEAKVFNQKIYVDSQTPQIIESHITANWQLMAEKGSQPIFVDVKINEPSYLQINVTDQKGFIVDSYQTLVAYNHFLEQWQISPNIYEQLDGDYRIDFIVTDRAGNLNKFFSEQFSIKKEHLLMANVALEKIIYKNNDPLKLLIDLVTTASVEVFISPQKDYIQRKSIYRSQKSSGSHTINIALPNDCRQGIKLLAIEVVDHQGQKDCFYRLLEIDDLNPEKAIIDIVTDTAYYGSSSLVNLRAIYNEDVNLEVYCQNKIIWSGEVKANKIQQITWDTKIDDQQLKPGSYFLIFSAKDQAGNIRQQKIEIKIIAYAPIVERIKTNRQVLVKNGYPSYDLLNFQYFIDEMSGPVVIDLQIIKNGQIIASPLSGYKRFPGVGSAFFNISDHKDIEEGNYNYLFKVTNARGITSVQNGSFFVITKPPIFQNFSFDLQTISPASDKNDKVNFLIQPYSSVFYEFVDNDQLKSMLLKVEITGDNFKQQKTLEIENGVQSFIWNGFTDKNLPLKDGEYLLKFWLIDQGGIVSQKQEVPIYITNALGRIVAVSSNISSNNFNPYEVIDNFKMDIELKYLNIRQKVIASLKDDLGNLIKKWDLLEFNGSANYQITWDGKDNTNNFVNDGKYYLEVQILDEVGNDFTYTHKIFPQFLINYSDQKIIRPADDTWIISPSVTINNLAELEYSYAKGRHTQLIKDTSTATHPAGAAHYFVIDHLNILNGSNFRKSRSRLIAYIYPNFSGQSSYTLKKNSPKQYHSTMSFLPGVYTFQLDNVEVWGSAWLVFEGMDVWYKTKSGQEKQVDALPLDLMNSCALERKRRLACIRVLADSVNFSHKVSCIANNIYYKRSKAIGSTQSTQWIQISQSGKICSEPSLTVIPGTDDLEICWLQKDSPSATPYLVSQKLPKNFRDVYQDQQQSLFATEKIDSVTDNQLTPQLDYHIAYPNPFYDKVTIRYKLSINADVVISILDLSGKTVATMRFQAGQEGGKKSSALDKYNDVQWDGRDSNGNYLNSGPYLYVIDTKDHKGRRMIKKGKLIKWNK